MYGQNMDMSKFSKRCLQRTDAALQVSVWDVCQSVFAKHHRTDAPWGWSLFANGRLERRWRTSKSCWNVNSSNFAFYSSSFELSVHFYMVQLYLTSFSSVQTQGRCPPFFPFHTVLAGGSWPGAPHHRCHPETPGGGPAPPSSCRVGSAPRCESPGHAHLHDQPCSASAGAGKAGWGGAEVFREERWWPSWRKFFRGIFFSVAKAWGLDSFFSISQYWLDCFLGRNTLLGPPSHIS